MQREIGKHDLFEFVARLGVFSAMGIRDSLEAGFKDYHIAELHLLSAPLGLQDDYENFVQEHPRLVA